MAGRFCVNHAGCGVADLRVAVLLIARLSRGFPTIWAARHGCCLIGSHTVTDSWTKVGTIAAIVAAAGTVAGLLLAWWYGSRAARDSRKVVAYDRLREARELVGLIQVNGDNTRWSEASEAQARLRVVLPTLGGEFPATLKLASDAWDLTTYSANDFGGHVRAARKELEESSQVLLG
jgi:hypothetical protein